jgi:hypothetical protein
MVGTPERFQNKLDPHLVQKPRLASSEDLYHPSPSSFSNLNSFRSTAV